MEEAPLFDGGLNTKVYPTDIDLSQTPSAQNVDFTDYGAFGTTLGYTAAIAAPGSYVVDGLFSYNNESSTAAELLMVMGSTVHYQSGTTAVTIPSAISLFTAGVDVEIEQFMDVAFFTNGQDRAYKYNGTEFTRMGVSAVTDTMTAATNAAGTLTGEYTYVRAGVNSYGVEGDFSVDAAVSTTFTAAAEAITVAGISTAPLSHGVESWNIYRNTAGAAGGARYRVTNVANGTTSFADDNSDSTISTAAPTDNAPPNDFKWFQNYQGYLFAAGDTNNPSSLFWSRVNTPERWPLENAQPIGDGDGLEISGISVGDSSIHIHKSDEQGNTALYAYFNDDPDPANWYLIKLNSNRGTESHKAITKWENATAYLNRNGFYGVSGNQLLRAAANAEVGKIAVDTISQDIEPDVQGFDKTLIKGAAGIDFNNRMYFAVPSASSSTENDKLYVYDYVRIGTSSRKLGAWIPFTGHNINNFTIHNGSLIGGSSTANGLIYELQTTRNFDGSAINSIFTTAPFKGKREHENRKKVFRHAYIWMDTSGDWPVSVSPIIDFDADGASATNINLNTDNSAVWDTAIWDTAVWANNIQRKRYRLDMNNTGNYLQLKFEINTVSQYFKVSRIQVFYNLKGKE